MKLDRAGIKRRPERPFRLTINPPHRNDRGCDPATQPAPPKDGPRPCVSDNSTPLLRGPDGDEIRVLLVNLDPAESFKVSRGDRIAQLVIQRFEHVEWDEVTDLDTSERGLQGWGSTG